MPEKVFLKPARPGLVVRDPATMEPLPDAGAYKSPSIYWKRRIREGSVILDDPPKNPKKTDGKG